MSNIFIGLKKDLFGCFRIDETVTLMAQEEEHGSSSSSSSSSSNSSKNTSSSISLASTLVRSEIKTACNELNHYLNMTEFYTSLKKGEVFIVY